MTVVQTGHPDTIGVTRRQGTQVTDHVLSQGGGARKKIYIGKDLICSINYFGSADGGLIERDFTWSRVATSR